MVRIHLSVFWGVWERDVFDDGDYFEEELDESLGGELPFDVVSKDEDE